MVDNGGQKGSKQAVGEGRNRKWFRAVRYNDLRTQNHFADRVRRNRVFITIVSCFCCVCETAYLISSSKI